MYLSFPLFFPTLCCLWWEISDGLIAAVEANYANLNMLSLHSALLVPLLSARDGPVSFFRSRCYLSESARDKNLWSRWVFLFFFSLFPSQKLRSSGSVCFEHVGAHVGLSFMAPSLVTLHFSVCFSHVFFSFFLNKSSKKFQPALLRNLYQMILVRYHWEDAMC